jgi:hypothetical protein
MPKRKETPEARRFVQIKTVILMSDAWRACDFSARCVFVELSARLQWASGQPEPANNGHLFISRDEWARAGFSHATADKGLRQLIQFGLIYKTRSGGIGRGCSRYALTCYSLAKNTDGLFLAGFRKDAWSKYVCSTECFTKKTRDYNLAKHKAKNEVLLPEKGDYGLKFSQEESESTIYRVKRRGGKGQNDAAGVSRTSTDDDGERADVGKRKRARTRDMDGLQLELNL